MGPGVISLEFALRGPAAPTEVFSMQHRSLFGWLLAGSFCAAVSCGGGDGANGPPGFGAACTTAKDCDSYDLLCGAADKCVQCVDESDCQGAEICSSGLCKAPQDCNDSRDCSGDLVCNETTGVCVDCVSSRDCKTGLGCVNNTCVTRMACDFTSDCTGGMVCDSAHKVCVDCRDDNDCGYKHVCEDNQCVPETVMGAAGSDEGGSAGKGGGGGSSGKGGGGSGGMSGGGGVNGGSGGTAAGMAGKGGSVGEGGVGGAADCGCTIGDACTPDQRCVSSYLIDDLVDCDDEILPIEGRKGNWAAEADIGINLMHGFTNPGSGWVDKTCAAWATGGELTVDNPNTTFAFIGFRLNVNGLDEGLAYDLTPYTGLQVKLESMNVVQVVLKTTGGGYFEYQLSAIAGSNLRTAPFASMSKMTNSAENLPIKLNTVYEVQFSVTTPKMFGLAVHSVTFY
jgi:hypothetical protein